MRIGFFDSGIGGVTVAQAVMKALPGYEYVYYADDTHMPYGNKEKSLIYTLTTDALRRMFEKKCELVILACNSASTVLPRIQQEWLPKEFPDRKVLGVIRPTVEHMVDTTKVDKVYVLATPVTVSSQSFDHELAKIQKSVDFHEIACPGLAEAIEYSADSMRDQNIISLCERYLESVPTKGAFEIYTGCTHYAFVTGHIKKIRPHTRVRNQGGIVAAKLVSYLSRHPEIEECLSRVTTPSLEILCSSGSKKYITKVEKALQSVVTTP
jgi:glutamate racemase